MLRVAIINDTSPTHHYGCMLVMENLIRLLGNQQVEIVWTWPVGIDWRKHKAKLSKLPVVDAFIVNGEGTIHHSADRKHARALAEFAGYALNHLQTPSYLINATLNQNTVELYEKLQSFKLVYVRDKGSLKELQDAGLCGRYVPDLTFAKAETYQYIPSKAGCVIDTALKKEIPILKSYSAENDFDFRSMVVARPSNVNFFRSPRPFVINIYKWLMGDRKVSLLPSSYIKYLAEHKIVITGRYHTVSMCLKNKIPFVAIESNTPKITFLLEDALKSSDRIVRFGDLTELNLEKYKLYSQSELESLEIFISAAESSIEDMIKVVVKDIKNDAKRIN